MHYQQPIFELHSAEVENLTKDKAATSRVTPTCCNLTQSQAVILNMDIFYHHAVFRPCVIEDPVATSHRCLDISPIVYAVLPLEPSW